MTYVVRLGYNSRRVSPLLVGLGRFLIFLLTLTLILALILDLTLNLALNLALTWTMDGVRSKTRVPAIFLRFCQNRLKVIVCFTHNTLSAYTVFLEQPVITIKLFVVSASVFASVTAASSVGVHFDEL